MKAHNKFLQSDKNILSCFRLRKSHASMFLPLNKVVKHMRKAFAFALRTPIAIMAGAVIYGVLSKPSLSDAIMSVAFLAFCAAIWLYVGTLNGPRETLKERLSMASKKMVRLGLVTISGIVIYNVLQAWWPNA